MAQLSRAHCVPFERETFSNDLHHRNDTAFDSGVNCG